VVVALAVVLAACGDGGGSDGQAGARAAWEVVLVTYSGYALPEAAAKAFTERTGLKIRVLATDDAGAALGRAILSAGDPEGDLFFGVDTTFLTQATGSDAFTRSKPAISDLPAQVVDPSGTLVPIDESTVCVNVDSSWFSEKGLAPPTTFADLADPRYRGLLVVEDPAASSPGLVFLAATVAEMGDGAPAYWARLRDNDVEISGGWSDAYFSSFTVNGGDRPLVVSYASSPPAEVMDSKDPAATPKSTVMAATCTRQVEYAGVLRGAANPKGAAQLLDEMQSEAWQAALPASNYVFPVRAGVPLPPAFEKFAIRPAHPVELDPAEVGRHRDDWLDRWRDTMG
jgi:thiamine transport system substrate-binding protein